MNKLHKGFTLIELFIVLILIAIIGVVASCVPKKAGAADLIVGPVIPTIPVYLNSGLAQYIYSDAGNLTIFDAGNIPWQTAKDACTDLKRLDTGLKHVTMIVTLADSIKIPKTKLPPISGLSEAVCN